MFTKREDMRMEQGDPQRTTQNRRNIAWERIKRAYHRRPEDKDSTYYLILCGTSLIMACLGGAVVQWIFR